MCVYEYVCLYVSICVCMYLCVMRSVLALIHVDLLVTTVQGQDDHHRVSN